MKACLAAVISLLLGVIWHTPASAAVAPVIKSLGRISQGLSVPGRLDVDEAGSVYVADAGKKAVFKYDKFGVLVTTYAAVPAAGTGLAVTPDGSRLYVSGRDVVTILDGATGAAIGHLGAGAGEFVYAGEIDLDASGYVFAADSATKYIRVYDPDGAFQYQFGGLGTTAGTFRSIWGLAVDERAGEVYVADVQTYGTSYPKIQVFDLAGTYRRALLATNGFGSVPIKFFSGFGFDASGRGYFLDSFGNDMRVLGLPSTYLKTFANPGYGVGQLNSPKDVVFDPTTSRLFVVCDGSRIEIFGIDGGQNPVAANEVPSVPVPASPVADSEVASVTPELLWQNATDPDGDALTYDVRVLQDGATVAEYAGLPEGEGTSFALVDVALTENGRYQWAVQSFDGEDASGWSEPQSFYVNATQEAPSVPVLLSPLAGETLAGDGLLSWQASVDPDPFDSLGYVVEIDADPAFGAVLIEQPVAGTSVTLADLSAYGDLEDGTTYFWRVKALDNHDVASEGSEAGSFLYDTTLLAVTANMPGAKVYLGGNNGYAGRYLGEAPLEARDFPVGAASVVVERAGFEPFVAQVRPLDGENVAVYAELVPAIAPADLKARPVQAGGADIIVGGESAPFAVDFDNDGLTDLLVAEASGALTLYRKALTAEGLEYFSQGESLGLPLVPGASPVVADWDNDGRKDILAGGADGTVTLFLNTGAEDAPAFGAGVLLQASGVPIVVGAAAVPAVIDLDGDGAKDLAVGSASGAVRLYANVGSDAAPQLSAAGNLLTLSSPVAPFFADWDGDGRRELLIAASEHLYRYVRKADGAYAPVEVLSIGSDLLNGSNGKSAKGAFSLGDRLRLFAFDADGVKGKDLLVGNAAGEVRLVASHGAEKVATFAGALADKVSQIDGLVRESAPELLPQVADIAAAVEAGDLKEAGRLTKTLAASVPAGTEIAKAVAELDALLR
jgi:DNA-binding beta-propeller fold protein YncE